MTDIARLISERARLWESHPIITESAILPTRPVQKAVALVLAASRKARASLAFWADPLSGKSSCLRMIEATVIDRVKGCGVLTLEAVEDQQTAEGRLLVQILKAVKYAHKIDSTLAGKRDQVNRALIALSGEARHLFILIDEGQEFSNSEFAWLKAVINSLAREGVKVTTVIFGQRELRQRRSELYENGRSDLGERFMKKLIEFKRCRAADELRSILEAVDDKSEFPTGSRLTYTQLLLPQAYAEGFRLKTISEDVWIAFQEIVPPKVLGKGLSMEVIAATIAAVCRACRDSDAAGLSISASVIKAAVKESLND